MENKSEKKTVEEAKKNPAVFAVLFEKYYSAIFRYALHRTGNAAVADDVTSETFFKALNKLSSFKWTGIPFSAWLYRIAGNEIIDYYRKHKRTPYSLDEPDTVYEVPDKNPSNDIENELIKVQEEIESNKKFLQVKDALKTLSVKYQEVIVLRYLEEKKITEIANVLGKSEGTIKSLLSRGIQQLKRYFGSDSQPL